MLKDSKTNKRHFIFDISSGYVSGAVVYFNKNSQKPTIEFSIKKEIIDSLFPNITELRKNTALALDEVCRSMASFINLSIGEFMIESGSVFFSSPWINFNNYTLVDEQIKPFEITEEYLESIIKKDLQNKNKKTLINSQIISVRANGYETNLQNLLGQKISKIDVSLVDTFMDSYNKEFIEKIINNHFNFLKLNFLPFLPVLFNQIKYIYDLEDDFIFLDLTGSVADFGIFRDNRIRNISSFPIGKNHILANMVKNGLATNMKKANSILIMYLRDELEEELKGQVKKIIREHGDEFKNDINKILDKFQTFNVPVNTFIVSSLETKFLLQDLQIFEHQIFIDEKIIKNFVEVDEKYFDSFLALEAEYLFIHILST